jgi:uncharacterized protein
MRSGWLLSGGDVVCALDMTESLGERLHGLRGRTSDEVGLYLPGARSVHTAGMKVDIDVAFLSDDLTVVRITRMKPWRVARGGRRVTGVVQADAGSLERWAVRVGDQLVVRQVA